jgi:chromosome segregation ATPase
MSVQTLNEKLEAVKAEFQKISDERDRLVKQRAETDRQINSLTETLVRLDARAATLLELIKEQGEQAKSAPPPPVN